MHKLDKKPFIVFTVTNDLSYDQRMQRHARTLVEAGFEVLLVGRSRSFSKPLLEEVFLQKRIKCFFEKGKFFYLEYNLRLFFFLLFCKASIYAAVDLDTLFPHLLVSIIKQKKLVFDSHEYFTEVPEVANRPFTRAVWHKLAKLAIPFTDLRYTVGPSLAKELERVYHLPFYSIMNVPALVRTENKKELEEKIILYQGALNEGRCLVQLINAMKSVEAILWIAGEGDLSNELRTLVDQNNLENKVKFLGFIIPSELPKLTEKAYIGFNVLEPNGLSYQFSLANKYFDYIHAFIPQLCSPFIEYETLNESNEVAVLTLWDENSIAYNLNKLLTDKELYQRLQNNCLKAAQEYNLQLESCKLVQLYQAL